MEIFENLSASSHLVNSTGSLLNLLDESAIGRETTLRVLRGAREFSLSVRPREQTEE